MPWFNWPQQYICMIYEPFYGSIRSLENIFFFNIFYYWLKTVIIFDWNSEFQHYGVFDMSLFHSKHSFTLFLPPVLMINEYVSGDSIIQPNKIIEPTLTIFALYFLYPISMLCVILLNLETTQAVEPFFFN